MAHRCSQGDIEGGFVEEIDNNLDDNAENAVEDETVIVRGGVVDEDNGNERNAMERDDEDDGPANRMDDRQEDRDEDDAVLERGFVEEIIEDNGEASPRGRGRAVIEDEEEKREYRASVACEPCYSRKKRCDRTRPCGNCVRRLIQNQCVDRVPKKRAPKNFANREHYCTHRLPFVS